LKENRAHKWVGGGYATVVNCILWHARIYVEALEICEYIFLKLVACLIR